MFVYFSTVKRKRPVVEGGELVKVNWETKEILKIIPIFPKDPDIKEDPNPRGNSRGGKGIIIRDNEIYLGTYHSICVYDPDTFGLKRKINNDLFAGVHELCTKNNDLWVSSTAIDCALKIDINGELIKSWWPREEKELQDKFRLTPLEIDKNKDNRLLFLHEKMSTKESHTHLNCVTNFKDRTYSLLNKLGLFVQIEPEFKIIINDKKIIGAHSAKIMDNGNKVLLCGSFSSSVLIYGLNSGKLEKQIDLQGFKEVKYLAEQNPDQPFNKTIFVRGLDIVDEERILVGVSPASILEIDIKENALLDIFRHSNDVGDAVHGLAHSDD